VNLTLHADRIYPCRSAPRPQNKFLFSRCYTQFLYSPSERSAWPRSFHWPVRLVAALLIFLAQIAGCGLAPISVRPHKTARCSVDSRAPILLCPRLLECAQLASVSCRALLVTHFACSRVVAAQVLGLGNYVLCAFSDLLRVLAGGSRLCFSVTGLKDSRYS
jgi:hypothetical protein